MKLKWPYNSELYMTIREIREAMPKLDFSNLRITKARPRLANLRRAKPTKPNNEQRETKEGEPLHKEW
ncbi:hypothetical protein LCGC14_1253150 [marine sediment metagenome]|uniref:Uncharacterized protein n=1 Tax=marine sediment metagenome TaxID=412755 RepID=A0A0F9LP20_9ZZZZ